MDDKDGVRRWVRRCLLVLLLIALPLLSTIPTVQGQNQNTAYWQYPTRTHHLLTADVNHDNIDEFVVVDNDNHVDLVTSSGSRLWRYTAPAPVAAVNTLNIDGPFQPQREIVLGTANELLLLTAEGDEIWRVPLNAYPVPNALLSNGGEEARTAWLARYEAPPIDIQPYDVDQDGHEEILVLLASGHLQRYDAAGNLNWRYNRHSNRGAETEPRLAISDIDQDGKDEIIIGRRLTLRRISQIELIDDDQLVWERPVEGRITVMTHSIEVKQAWPRTATAEASCSRPIFSFHTRSISSGTCGWNSQASKLKPISPNLT